jgi:hypothetical protein
LTSRAQRTKISAVGVKVKKVYINSYYHYQLQQHPEDPNKLLFLEFGTGDPDDEDYELCPGLEQRAAFKPHEGKVIAEFVGGEEVEFISGSFKSKITADKADKRVRCADDLSYHFGILLEEN